MHPGGSSNPANRRRYARVAFFVPVVLTLVPERRQMQANSIDLSLGGVGLASPRLLATGQVVSVRFVLGEITVEVMGRVVHGHADEQGCVLGVEFLELLDSHSQPELMRRLLGRSALEARL